MKTKLLTLLALFAMLPLVAMADEAGAELNCTVEVNAQQINLSNKQIFQTLQEAITEYMNNTKWTDAQFAINEKIVCKLFLTVAEYNEGTGQMKGNLQIQSQRPVYNSNYMTTIFNFKDTKIDFVYEENEPLIYSDQDMQSNLTAILNFYAFLIIGMDFDTFGLKSGDPYFEKAANVVRMAQTSGESGWKAFEDRKNRSALLSVFTDKPTEGYREMLYNYHRLGLDQMSVSVDKGRSTITKQIDLLKAIYDADPMNVCLTMFKDAKLDELVNVYSKANSSERESVYETLYALYPTEQTRLNKIKNPDNTN